MHKAQNKVFTHCSHLGTVCWWRFNFPFLWDGYCVKGLCSLRLFSCFVCLHSCHGLHIIFLLISFSVIYFDEFICVWMSVRHVKISFVGYYQVKYCFYLDSLCAVTFCALKTNREAICCWQYGIFRWLAVWIGSVQRCEVMKAGTVCLIVEPTIDAQCLRMRLRPLLTWNLKIKLYPI